MIGGRQPVKLSPHPVNLRPQPVKLESTCKFKAQTADLISDCDTTSKQESDF